MASTSMAGPSDGLNGSHHDQMTSLENDPRRQMEIPTLSNEFIPIDFNYMFDEAESHEAALDEIASILEAERAPVRFWIRLVEEVWRIDKWAAALDLIQRGLRAIRDFRQHVPLLCMQATYNLALARQAPKQIIFQPRAGRRLTASTNPNHPDSRSMRPDEPPSPKSTYWAQVETAIIQAERIDRNDRRIRDVKLTLALARNRMDEAVRISDAILAEEPTNLMALMARARTLFAKRAFRPALRNYQQVLALNSSHLPDPRIGIGLCFWVTGEKDKARKAWERSATVNPSGQGATLLALAHLNAAKDPTHVGGVEGRSADYELGMKMCEGIFKRDNTNASVIGALSNLFLTKGEFQSALKLSERMCQFADARALESEAHLLMARVLHSTKTRDNIEAAVDSYSAAAQVNSENLPAKLAAVQMTLRRTQIAPQAVSVLDGIIQKQPRCIEALAMLGAVTTQNAFSLVVHADSEAERKKAKDYYEQILNILNISRGGQSIESDLQRKLAASNRVAQVAQSPELFIDIAKLWSDDATSIKSLQGYREAVRLEEEKNESARPELLNNVGVLEYHRKDFEGAANRFEDAGVAIGEILKKTGQLPEELDAILTTITYNIAVAAEGTGDIENAKNAYQQILGRHPEYTDAKARLALIALKAKDFEMAHSLLKEALTAKPEDYDLRAMYTYCLFTSSPLKMARDFCITTLREKRHEIYSLTAAGIITYNLTREDKDQSREAIKQRPEKWRRAAEFFEKALQLDPHCASAAQGVAIAIAEGNLGTGVEVTATQAALSESAARARNARDALAIFMKVRESINDASVYVNIGHCHYLREEFEQAIESYAAASRRYHQDKDLVTLLYLARAWFAKGSKELSYASLTSALDVARKALEQAPEDLTVQYNLALIEQKGCEILFELQPSQRTLAELDRAIADGEESIRIFERLAGEPQEKLPLSKDFVSQRAKYGQNVARRGPDARNAQISYEETEQAKIQRAKQAREEERLRREAAEAERREQIRLQAEALAEQRRKMREEAAQWIEAAKALDSDDEEKKKRKRSKGTKKQRDDGVISSDDDGEEEREKPVKKKKRAKKEKTESGSATPANGAGEGMNVDSDEEEEQVVKPSRSKKQFKSAEFVEDSDDE